MGKNRVLALILGSGIAIGLLSCQHAGAIETIVSQPDRPIWPESYQVTYEVDVPYVEKLQKKGLQVKFQAWRDAGAGLQKVVKDDVQISIESLKEGVKWEIYPRIDKLDCDALRIKGAALGGPQGPGVAAEARRLLSDSTSLQKKPRLALLLPDLSVDKWQYNGTDTLSFGRHKGLDAYRWVWTVKDDLGYGEYINTYTFYVSKEGAPLVLDTLGANLWTGGHFDRYVATFYDYKEGNLSPQVFEPPDICVEGPDSAEGTERASLLSQWHVMLPNPHYGDEEYDGFVHRHGRRHGSREEYEDRRALYHQKKAFIDSWNARASPDDPHAHKLSVNRFADWTRQEYLDALLPNRLQRREGEEPFGGPFMRVHQAKVPAGLLPSTVDWRGTPQDTVPKDQAMCGSCWAFGTVGAIESAYYRATGEAQLFSEQQLIDCNWTPKGVKPANQGCWGGYQDQAFDWIFRVNGGLATEDDYPYASSNRFCRKDVKPVRFNGTYSWVKGGNEALMEALYSVGPMTVSVDAEADDFAFYRSGIYNNTKCATKLKGLDHAVLISGYGSTEDGRDYWIVKNTWSTLWGEGGYIRIARDPDDCGITAQPLYVDLEILDD